MDIIIETLKLEVKIHFKTNHGFSEIRHWL